MAVVENERTFLVHNLSIGDEDVGGTVVANLQTGFDGVISHLNEALIGERGITRRTQFVRGSFQTQDIVALITLIGNAEAKAGGILFFEEKQKDVSVAIQHKLAGVTDVTYLQTSMNFAAAAGQALASGTINFEVEHTDVLKGIADSYLITDPGTPGIAHPFTRFLGPTVASFDPTGAGPAVVLGHPSSIAVNVNTVDLARLQSDGAIGYNAVVARRVELTGTLRVEDTDITGTSPDNLTVIDQLLDVDGQLTVTLEAEEAGSTIDIILENLKFTGITAAHAAEGADAGHDMAFRCFFDATRNNVNSGTDANDILYTA